MMTLEEVVHSNGSQIWFEAEFSNSYRCYVRLCGNSQSRVHFRSADNEFYPLKRDYGKRWRCYHERPQDEGM